MTKNITKTIKGNHVERVGDREIVDIILVTFNRLNFLKHTVEKIYERTRYPYRLWVVDNNSTDGTKLWLKKQAKTLGLVYDHILLDENKGLAGGFSEGFKHIKSEYFITTQDDIVPPDLNPCWLERILRLAENNPDYGGISMRIQRVRRVSVDELDELIDTPKNCASVFRVQKKSDIEAIGDFGDRKHWESVSFRNRMMKFGKKFAIATHIYADHTGFMPKNKGFKDGFSTYHTYSKERVNQGELQPYPKIDVKTNVPIEINEKRDEQEQGKREACWNYWGVDKRRTHRRTPDQVLLAEYAKEGKGLDIGCGRVKCHKNAIGMDVFPFESVGILGDCRDLWMFKDNELDFIVASHTLEHMPDVKGTLKEWIRVLKVGGILGIAVPDCERAPRAIRGTHKFAFTKQVMKIILEKDGLNTKVIRIEDIKRSERKPAFLTIAKKIK